MFCAISGTVPKEPVLSTSSKHIFEKQLLLKYRKENAGKDPISHQVLEDDQIIEIANDIKEPKQLATTSIPALLTALQNEWDATMLQLYSLKQSYSACRQELSNALYENDAAKRVIARLIKERDEARQGLENGIPAPRIEKVEHVQEMEIDEREGGLPANVIAEIDEKSKDLSAKRRKRKPSSDAATPEQIQGLSQTSSISSLHSASGGGGIMCMDIIDNDSVQAVITGGKDGHALITNPKSSDEVLGEVKAHSKKINDILWHESACDDSAYSFMSASLDKTVKYWTFDNNSKKSKNMWSFKGHKGEVNGLCLHATKTFIASCSADSTCRLIDISKGEEILEISSPEVSQGFSSIDFHPDGLLLGTGTIDSTIRIWDIKANTIATSFSDFTGKVSSISFSENGYYLASSSECNLVKIWDLRKLSNIYTIELPEPVSMVKFDPSAQFLGVAHGQSLSVFLNKQWTELLKLSDHESMLSCFGFGRNSKTLYSAGLDRKLILSGEK